MKPLGPFGQWAQLESLRAQRAGRSFCLLRIALIGQGDAELLVRIVSSNLRRSDFVARVNDGEVGALLYETTHAEVVSQRLREVLAEARIEVRIGWGAVNQRRTWQEAWRWAGQLLVADGAVKAAA